MSRTKQIEVKGNPVSLFQANNEDFISLTDIAKSKDGDSSSLIHSNCLITVENTCVS